MAAARAVMAVPMWSKSACVWFEMLTFPTVMSCTARWAWNASDALSTCCVKALYLPTSLSVVSAAVRSAGVRACAIRARRLTMACP